MVSWKILHRKQREMNGTERRDVRRAQFAWGVILTTAAAGPPAAQAVELRNRDRIVREVTINHSDGKSEVSS